LSNAFSASTETQKMPLNEREDITTNTTQVQSSTMATMNTCMPTGWIAQEK
jgi:hypothetical protein